MANVLLVEDDTEIRGLLERFLKRSGFLVTTALDGDTGLKLFTEGHFDLVLTDGLLPKKTGYDLSAAIRKQPKGKDVGIVMITAAFKGPKAKKDAFDQGVDAFFSKPFILGDLKDKLVELLLRQGKGINQPPSTPSLKPQPKPASSTEFVAPPKTEPKKKAEPPPLPKDLVVGAPHEVARLLLTCARHRLTGTVAFADESSQLKLAFLRGVVVGAGDNLREHLLGERLWKQGRLSTEQMRTLNTRMAEQGERVAEALLALGMCTADEALGFVDEQAVARVRRAILWTGAVRVVEDADDVQRMAVSSLELVDVIFAFGLEQTQIDEALRFVAKHKSELLAKPHDFDDLLMALARVKPSATLPGVMLAGGTPSVAEAAASSSPSEVYASWLAGLVRLKDDVVDPRRLPEVLKSELSAALVDRPLVTRICGMLLKARGRSFYDLLEMPRDVSSESAVAKLEELAREIGPDAVAGKSLGPAASAARELWAILDDAYQTFADPARREAHDAASAPKPAPAPASAPSSSSNEDAFLQGQQALSSGDLENAVACFELAVDARPKDPEYGAYLGWAQVLIGDKAGVQRLVTVFKENPQSMRPLFFLGLVAAKNGDIAKAKMLLGECVRRAPLDVEVQAALSALS